MHLQGYLQSLGNEVIRAPCQGHRWLCSVPSETRAWGVLVTGRDAPQSCECGWPLQKHRCRQSHGAVGRTRNRSKVCAWVSVQPPVTSSLGVWGLFPSLSSVCEDGACLEKQVEALNNVIQLHLTVWNTSHLSYMFECGQYAQQFYTSLHPPRLPLHFRQIMGNLRPCPFRVWF